MMKCHMCEQETDFWCDRCELPVCEDCCVQMTIHNQIDYPLCTDCDDTCQAHRYLECCLEEDVKEAKQKKRDEINAKRRANYWKPENVTKRRVAKQERQLEAQAQKIKSLQDVGKIFGSLFKNM